MLFCSLRRNVEASRHTHFVVVPVNNKRRRIPAMSVTNLSRSDVAVCITLGGRTVNNTRWSQIFVENRDFCLPNLHSKPPLGIPAAEYCYNAWYRIIRMVWLPNVRKIIGRCVYSFRHNARAWQTDRQTDRQTNHRQIDRQTTNRQTNRQTDRQTDNKQTDRWTWRDGMGRAYA